jgi:hypothetical protein
MKRKKSLAAPAGDMRMRIYRERMQTYEQAVRAGNLPALVDAVEDCVQLNMPPPPWMIDAVATVVVRQMLVRTGDGRFNSRQARWEENQKHLARWDMVRELLERGRELYERTGDVRGLTKENAYAAVAEELQGTFAAGREDAVKYSYDLVEKGGYEFCITRFEPNGKSG